MTKSSISTHAFGLRSPDSQGIGKWDGAFVYAATEDSSVIGIFYNNIDHIGHPDDMHEVYKQYDLLKKGGWKPMSVEDLTKTAGIKVTKETNLRPAASTIFTYIMTAFIRFNSLLRRIFVF